MKTKEEILEMIAKFERELTDAEYADNRHSQVVLAAKINLLEEVIGG